MSTSTDEIGGLDPDGARDPWDQWPGEPDVLYSSFVTYRELGRTRTVRRLAELTGKGMAHLYNTSAEWSWVERARRYDEEQDRLYNAEMMDARLTMGRQQLTIANMLLAKGVDALRNLDASRLSPRELREYIEAAVKLQRLVAGEATDRVETNGTMTHVDLSPAEARVELEHVQAEIARRLADGPRPTPAPVE